MRVGLVVPGFSADPRDWCIPALRHLARALAYRDDLRVIAIRYPYRAGRYAIDGAETIALGGAVRHRAATLDLWRTALGTLRAEHRRRPFDVLHAFWATESGLLATLAGKLLRVPTLVSLAGGELVGLRDIGYGDQRIAWERLKVAASLRWASGVSAGSRQLAAMAEARLREHRPPGTQACVHLAPLGVDTDLFTPPHNPHSDLRRLENPRLVHVGTLTPVKDQATLLRAFACVRRAGVPATLDIVGSGPLQCNLERQARELGLDGSLRFRGEIDHAELPSVYRVSDALVMASRHEAQCMVGVEAAACGTSVVSTRVGVIPDLTRSIAAVGDVDGLAEAIASQLAEPSRATSLMSLEEVRATFSLDACADRFRGLYASLMTT
ncbi:MAG TPA: glycosyltransferase [Chloroflexota bacterium]|jgi:glycosyltransferase involved in cell wall biosynthesis